jgi:hypothetical protein
MQKKSDFFITFHLIFGYEMIYSVFGTRRGILFFYETNALLAFQIGFWPNYKALPLITSNMKK